MHTAPKHPQMLDRYNRRADGTIIVDVSVKSISDLYNFFDRKTSYSKRDLDEDFVLYLIECQREIRKYPFVIRISIESGVDKNGETKILSSIKNYFLYLRNLEIRNLRKMLKHSGLLFILGLGLITLNVKLPLSRLFPQGMIGQVLSEGIIIAAWVSLWEVFANIIMKWPPIQQNITIYTKISEAPVSILSGS